MTITRSDLSPCPFCGSDDLITSIGPSTPDHGVEMVECNHCGSAAQYRNWNRRAEAAPVAEAVAWEVTAVRGGVSMQHATWKTEKDADGWVDHYKARDCLTTKTPLYTAPPHDAELVELLRDCYPGCGLTARQTVQIRERIDTYLATLPRT